MRRCWPSSSEMFQQLKFSCRARTFCPITARCATVQFSYGPQIVVDVVLLEDDPNRLLLPPVQSLVEKSPAMVVRLVPVHPASGSQEPDDFPVSTGSLDGCSGLMRTISIDINLQVQTGMDSSSDCSANLMYSSTSSFINELIFDSGPLLLLIHGGRISMLRITTNSKTGLAWTFF